jgi:UDP-N-acetylglucosamine 2-epimerase (non-hydrolysing)
MNNNNLKILLENELNNSIAVVVGTRPSIVKMSPLIKEIQNRTIPLILIHSGQHYSNNMSQDFFEELDLPKPQYLCETVKNKSYHGAQTAEMLTFIEQVLIKEKPKIVLVGGDANTNLAAALAARKLRINVGHVEAGLRSYNWDMPEEHNRVIIDHISDFLFTPSMGSKKILRKDDVKGKIYVVGNTIVDAINNHLILAKQKSNILKLLKLSNKNYFLITVHREENVDNKEKMKKLYQILMKLSDLYERNLVFPMHPRTLKRIKQFNLYEEFLKIPTLIIINPVSYLDFLILLNGANVVLTDSGGVQQEACIIKSPCLTLRSETEWVETIKIKANYITDFNIDKIIYNIDTMLSNKPHWRNPFGNIGCSKRIVDIIINELDLNYQ